MALNMDDDRERFERVAACPACGGTRLRPWKKGSIGLRALRPEDVKITDSRYGLTWDLGRCDDCGHIFADPCPTPAFIASLYGALEDPLYEEEAGGRAMNFRRVLARLERLRPEKGRLFDVGAATGILMNLARERGWEVDGVEPSAWAVAFARDRYGLAVREGVFETAAVPPASFDVVTMVDLIEHTARPYDAVRRAAEVLRPGRSPVRRDTGHPERRGPARRTGMVASPARPIWPTSRGRALTPSFVGPDLRSSAAGTTAGPSAPATWPRGRPPSASFSAAACLLFWEEFR